MNTAPQLAIVVIGRDEGANVTRALHAVVAAAHRLHRPTELVFVDSGSRDDSVQRAQAFASDGVVVVQLPREGGNAASARNAGLAATRAPLVQFLDGDMEVDADWLPTARQHLEAHRVLAAVAGQLDERSLQRTLWGATFGLDWDRTVGRVPVLGGAALWRRTALAAVGGFDPGLTVGEDPDLCCRVRERGWQLARLAIGMARHDLDLRGPGAWWSRAIACGTSRANVQHRHGEVHPRPLRRRLLPIAFAMLAGLACVGWPATGLAGALLLLSALVLRRGWLDRRDGNPWPHAIVHGLHSYGVKVPVAIGVWRQRRRLGGGTGT